MMRQCFCKMEMAWANGIPMEKVVNKKSKESYPLSAIQGLIKELVCKI